MKTLSTPKKRRGRRPKFVPDVNGNDVVGLSYDKHNNRYYYTFWRREGIEKGNFGKGDYHLALFEFNQWMKKREGLNEKVSFPFDKTEFDMKVKEGGTTYKGMWRTRIKAGDAIITTDIPDEILWAKVREAFIHDTEGTIKKIGLPIEIKDIGSMRSMKIQELGALYFDKRRPRPLSKSYMRQCKKQWHEFIRIVGVSEIKDITLSTILDYQETIYKRAERKSWSAFPVNSRFSLVKSVFGSAAEFAPDPSQIPHLQTICGYLKRLVFMEKPNFKPKPISRKNYLSILNSEKEPTCRAMWLMALNTGMKPTCLSQVKKEHVDLERKTLAMQRPKSRIIRAAMLWDRTVEAIQQMQVQVDNETEFVFLNSFGKPISTQAIRAWFRKKRKQLGIDEQVKFEHCRDAAETIPRDINPEGSSIPIKILMGHRVAGMDDNYQEKRPSITRNVVAAIEQYYFGKE